MAFLETKPVLPNRRAQCLLMALHQRSLQSAWCSPIRGTADALGMVMNTARRARVDEVVGAMRLTAPEGLESRPVDRRGSHRRITIVGSLGVASKGRWSTAPKCR